MANLYFLLLSIFQCVPQISNTLGVPTILLPLSFVIFVDAVFAALEVRKGRRKGIWFLGSMQVPCVCKQ